MRRNDESDAMRGGAADRLSASPRLFKSDILDKLSRVHHLTPLVVYAPVVAVLVVLSVRDVGWVAAFLLAGLGFVGWSLTEYLGHRFLFHRVLPLPFGLGERVQFLIHGVHHEHPSDPLRLVMPPLLSMPILLIAYLVIRGVFSGAWTWPVLAGFTTGYVLYDLTHYWLHHGVPRSRLARHARRMHMRHHFRDDSRNFGVLSIWWDHVFGTTAPPPAGIRRKAHARDGSQLVPGGQDSP